MKLSKEQRTTLLASLADPNANPGRTPSDLAQWRTLLRLEYGGRELTDLQKLLQGPLSSGTLDLLHDLLIKHPVNLEISGPDGGLLDHRSGRTTTVGHLSERDLLSTIWPLVSSASKKKPTAHLWSNLDGLMQRGLQERIAWAPILHDHRVKRWRTYSPIKSAEIDDATCERLAPMLASMGHETDVPELELILGRCSDAVRQKALNVSMGRMIAVGGNALIDVPAWLSIALQWTVDHAADPGLKYSGGMGGGQRAVDPNAPFPAVFVPAKLPVPAFLKVLGASALLHPDSELPITLKALAAVGVEPSVILEAVKTQTAHQAPAGLVSFLRSLGVAGLSGEQQQLKAPENWNTWLEQTLQSAGINQPNDAVVAQMFSVAGQIEAVREDNIKKPAAKTTEEKTAEKSADIAPKRMPMMMHEGMNSPWGMMGLLAAEILRQGGTADTLQAHGVMEALGMLAHPMQRFRSMDAEQLQAQLAGGLPQEHIELIIKAAVALNLAEQTLTEVAPEARFEALLKKIEVEGRGPFGWGHRSNKNVDELMGLLIEDPKSAAKLKDVSLFQNGGVLSAIADRMEKNAEKPKMNAAALLAGNPKLASVGGKALTEVLVGMSKTAEPPTQNTALLAVLDELLLVDRQTVVRQMIERKSDHFLSAINGLSLQEIVDSKPTAEQLAEVLKERTVTADELFAHPELAVQMVSAPLVVRHLNTLVQAEEVHGQLHTWPNMDAKKTWGNYLETLSAALSGYKRHYILGRETVEQGLKSDALDKMSMDTPAVMYVAARVSEGLKSQDPALLKAAWDELLNSKRHVDGTAGAWKKGLDKDASLGGVTLSAIDEKNWMEAGKSSALYSHAPVSQDAFVAPEDTAKPKTPKR